MEAKVFTQTGTVARVARNLRDEAGQFVVGEQATIPRTCRQAAEVKLPGLTKLVTIRTAYITSPGGAVFGLGWLVDRGSYEAALRG